MYRRVRSLRYVESRIHNEGSVKHPRPSYLPSATASTCALQHSNITNAQEEQPAAKYRYCKTRRNITHGGESSNNTPAAEMGADKHSTRLLFCQTVRERSHRQLTGQCWRCFLPGPENSPPGTRQPILNEEQEHCCFSSPNERAHHDCEAHMWTDENPLFKVLHLKE